MKIFGRQSTESTFSEYGDGDDFGLDESGEYGDFDQTYFPEDSDYETKRGRAEQALLEQSPQVRGPNRLQAPSTELTQESLGEGKTSKASKKTTKAPAQVDLKNYAKTGAIIGAIAGAVAGFAFANPIVGAMAGAAVGALLGLAVGLIMRRVAKNKAPAEADTTRKQAESMGGPPSTGPPGTVTRMDQRGTQALTPDERLAAENARRMGLTYYQPKTGAGVSPHVVTFHMDAANDGQDGIVQVDGRPLDTKVFSNYYESGTPWVYECSNGEEIEVACSEQAFQMEKCLHLKQWAEANERPDLAEAAERQFDIIAYGPKREGQGWGSHARHHAGARGLPGFPKAALDGWDAASTQAMRGVLEQRAECEPGFAEALDILDGRIPIEMTGRQKYGSSCDEIWGAGAEGRGENRLGLILWGLSQKGQDISPEVYDWYNPTYVQMMKEVADVDESATDEVLFV
jgi:hypothetical protein